MRNHSKVTTQVFHSGSRHEPSMRNVSHVSRRDSLRSMLIEMRDQEIARLDELARTETRTTDALLMADDLDNARSQEDLDLHISLIDLAEARLNSALDALERLERNEFGVCSECGDEISFERLRAVPMAARCVECQQKFELSTHTRMMRSPNMISAPALFDAYQTESRSPDPAEQDGPAIPAPDRTARRRRHSARQ